MLRRLTTFPVAIAMLFALWATGAFSVAQENVDADGFTSIFDGQSLEGWDGDTKHWSVVDGAITGVNSPENELKKNTFIIWKDKVADFDLRLKIRIVGGNSGIQFRSQLLEEGTYRIGGYQADFDAAKTWAGILYDEAGRAILAKRGQKVVIGEDAKPVETGNLATEQKMLDSIKNEDWNDYRVLAVGNHIQLFINGIQTVDVTDDDPKNRDMEGLLALQLHTGPPMTVSFKDIKIKKVAKPAAPLNTSSSNTSSSNSSADQKKKSSS